MKRLLSYLGAFTLGATVFGALGAFVGYEIAQSGTPAVLVCNFADAEVTQVVVHSDIGQSHPLGSVSPRASKGAELAGGDQLVWVTLTTAEGNTLESEHVYTTSGVVHVAAICGGAITFEPVL